MFSITNHSLKKHNETVNSTNRVAQSSKEKKNHEIHKAHEISWFCLWLMVEHALLYACIYFTDE